MATGTYTPLATGASPALGTSGDAVKALQTQLNTQNAGKAGYVPLAVDGKYGPLTQAATSFKTTSSVPSQSGIVQDTTAINTKDNKTGAKIDEKAGAITGTGAVPVPAYGSKNADGSINAFDPNTGLSTDPNKAGAGATAQPGSITTKDGGTYSMSAPAGFNYTLPTPADGSKYVYGADGKPYLQDKAGNVTSDPTADAEYNANKDAKAALDERVKLLDSYKQGLDATHQSLVDSIISQATAQKAKMEVLNKRMLGLKTVQGYRTGSAEYTPEIDTGILKAETEEGYARLDEIDSNMKLAIAQAVAAKSDKDFELASKRLDLVAELQKNKETTIQNIYKAYIDNAKMVSDKMKEADTLERANRDQALQELSVSAPELVKQFDSLKKPEEQKLWLQLVSKKTGLDETILKGSLEKVRLDVANKESILNKRESPADKAVSATQKASVLKKEQDNDIAGAVLYFQDIMNANKWAGVNPEDYKYYKTEIRKKYGADAVLQFDKAIKDAKLAVDYGEGV